MRRTFWPMFRLWFFLMAGLYALLSIFWHCAARAATTVCEATPCDAVLDFAATIVPTASLAVDDTVLPSGERLIVAVESCTGCDEPGARESRWVTAPGVVAVYRYGEGLRERYGDRWYAARRAPDDKTLGQNLLGSLP